LQSFVEKRYLLTAAAGAGFAVVAAEYLQQTDRAVAEPGKLNPQPLKTI
jgi:hypothetical protein